MSLRELTGALRELTGHLRSLLTALLELFGLGELSGTLRELTRDLEGTVRAPEVSVDCPAGTLRSWGTDSGP